MVRTSAHVLKCCTVPVECIKKDFFYEMTISIIPAFPAGWANDSRSSKSNKFPAGFPREILREASLPKCNLELALILKLKPKFFISFPFLLI